MNSQDVESSPPLAAEESELSVETSIDLRSNSQTPNVAFVSNLKASEDQNDLILLQRRSNLEIHRGDECLSEDSSDHNSLRNLCASKSEFLANSYVGDDSKSKYTDDPNPNSVNPKQQTTSFAFPAIVEMTATSSMNTNDANVIKFDAMSQKGNSGSSPVTSDNPNADIPSDVIDILTQADEESRIPDRETSDVFLNQPVPVETKRKKKRRRRRKKKPETAMNAGDSGLQQENDSENSSESDEMGCLGMMDSRSVNSRNRQDQGGDPAANVIISVVRLPHAARRTRIPDRPNYSLNLWSLLKNSMGKELSKIPMPVNFSEPLSMLQRLTEDYEYSDVLHKAARCKDPCEQMCYVAAFTISSYATTSVRTAKPFNPLLGETYEWDRMEDLGFRSLSEQVSHHPPSAALYCEGVGWTCWQEFTMTSKFRGNSLEIIPLGIAHLTFEATGNHYTWRKVTTFVRNIIIGRLWVEQVGDMVITNHTTGDKCQLSYIPYSVFNKKQKEVTGTVKTALGSVKWVINGSWDTKVEAAEIKSMGKTGDIKPSEKSFITASPIVLWTRRLAPPEAEKYYNFTEFATQLNELEVGVAPTDSRLRPDQRLMEDGKWDEANAEKLRLEDKQRNGSKRKNSQRNVGTEESTYKPAWFEKEKDLVEGTAIYTYKGEYWKCKDDKNWSRCPDIF